jgi:hypothetical protein
VGKYVLLDHPVALPGQCKTCGSATKSPMVDMGYSENDYGAVYFCIDCITEIAGVVGFIDSTKHHNLQQYLVELEERVLDLERVLSFNSSLLDIIKEAGYVRADSTFTINVADSGISTTSVSSIEAEKSEFLDIANSHVENTGDAVEGDSTIVESSSDENLGTVRSSTSSRNSSDKSKSKIVI